MAEPVCPLPGTVGCPVHCPVHRSGRYADEPVTWHIVKQTRQSARSLGNTRRRGGGARWMRERRVTYLLVSADGVERGPYDTLREARAVLAQAKT